FPSWSRIPRVAGGSGVGNILSLLQPIARSALRPRTTRRRPGMSALGETFPLARLVEFLLRHLHDGSLRQHPRSMGAQPESRTLGNGTSRTPIVPGCLTEAVTRRQKLLAPIIAFGVATIGLRLAGFGV